MTCPDGCWACWLEPGPDEPRADWLARIKTVCPPAIPGRMTNARRQQQQPPPPRDEREHVA